MIKMWPTSHESIVFIMPLSRQHITLSGRAVIAEGGDSSICCYFTYYKGLSLEPSDGLKSQLDCTF